MKTGGNPKLLQEHNFLRWRSGFNVVSVFIVILLSEVLLRKKLREIVKSKMQISP